MRKVTALVLIAFVAMIGLSAQVKGPIVDKILINTKTQEDIALKDVATGNTDLFNYSTGGPAFKALPNDVKAKLDPYDNTGSSYISLATNPFPNKAPYTGVVEGKTIFNPLAIREVRFALNFLINRKQVVDEILVGAGVPMYTPVTPGQPNSSRFGLVASKLGFTATGNERRALADIATAMQKAADLPENKGKLVKGDKWWTYEGQPVTLKFLIRVDDPTVRLPEGRYIADQIEKAGIKVERLEWDRTKCFSLYLKDDPKNLSWNLYTEGWSGGQTYAFWETNIAQMYAPWYANMPGGNTTGWWSYDHAELDKLTSDCVNGRVTNTDDYYAKLLKATDLGLKEGVRIFVASQTVYYCANKGRFNTRMVTGAGDGVNKFSFYTADVKPEKDGTKVLRSTQFSSRGALFMSAWDPIGPDGCSDTYSQAVVQCLGDPEWIANPITGIPMPVTASWSNVKTDIKVDGDTIVGKIPVPKDAVLWNAVTEKWESGIVYVDVKGDASEYGYKKSSEKPEYATAFSSVNYKLKTNKWHHGRMITQADFRYAYARPFELCINRGKDDKLYEESYAGSINPNLPRTKGVVFNKDGTITVYGDVNYPMDVNTVAQLLLPTLMIEASQYSTYIPWEIHEAIKFMVSEGSASKTVYVFNANGDFSEIDLISEQCVKDIKAKLAELVARKWVPASLVGFVTPDEAVKGYKDAIAFIEKHGHAWISNGGFVLDKYDASNNTAILVANRDKAYPFEKGYFTKLLSTNFARVDAVKVPAYKKGAGLAVGITVSDVAFPANTSKPAAKANVKVTLIADKETTYAAKLVKAGSFQASIPAKDLDSLKPGSYTIVVEAAFGTEAGAVETANVIVF
jgi:peptide/nickel transport system substrate-binding protein